MKAKANRSGRLRPRAGIEPKREARAPLIGKMAGWGDELVVLAVAEVARELPAIKVALINEAASQCRRDVPVTAGISRLRHCIRQRALGLLFQATSRPEKDWPFRKRASGGLR